MKFLSVGLASLTLVSAASVAKPVDYDGWKVYRVNVGDDSTKLASVVDNLKLATWKGKVATSKVVDLMVPPTQIQDFEKSAEGLNTEVMHENLGASISDETKFSVYAGKFPT
jgi:carboxypeptidase A4